MRRIYSVCVIVSFLCLSCHNNISNVGNCRLWLSGRDISWQLFTCEEAFFAEHNKYSSDFSRLGCGVDYYYGCYYSNYTLYFSPDIWFDLSEDHFELPDNVDVYIDDNVFQIALVGRRNILISESRVVYLISSTNGVSEIDLK